jgi:outer membrane protein OmpA-like peptidoglycan-associated protein
MNLKAIIILLLLIIIQNSAIGQQDTYTIRKAFFSTDKFDEFSPVYYSHGIIFCTNRPLAKFFNYIDSEDKNFITISFADSLGPGSLQTVKLFSKDLNSKLNNGPITFNGQFDTAYFSRNILIDRKMSELSSGRNKLGIFSAVYLDNKWTKIRELRLNSEWYNNTMPCLSPDGKRLYFASDRPGGYGGSDLYYCQWQNDYWSEPINMGSVINTKGNEGYPFINAAGEFFFSSDGHPGFGGKDIFFSRLSDTIWTKPICLDAPINSEFDDFGICTDTLMNQGYFSSNREKSLDIYHFTTNYPQVFYNSEQKKNNYCFIFNDTGSIDIDTINLWYVWSFGDGSTAVGRRGSHCFSGPGLYNVRLDIDEVSTGKVFFTQLLYELNVHDFEQAFISSPDYAVKGDEVMFDGRKSYLPGYKIVSYSWDFGDKSKADGIQVKHTFLKQGKYEVNLELVLKSDSTGQFRKTGTSKNINILDNEQQYKSLRDTTSEGAKIFTDVRNSANTNIKYIFSAESEVNKNAVFQIELFSSKTRMDTRGEQFRKVPAAYTVKETYDPVTRVYNYTIDQEQSLMATYLGFNKMATLGFKNVKIKMVILTDPEEKELNNLVRINGSFADTYFDSSDRLTSNAFIILDQVVKLMNKYPSMKLQIGVHTDNTGRPENNQALSQKRAQLLADYLENRGINAQRVIATGFGSSKPIFNNSLGKNRKLNSRIEFTIIAK